MTVDTQEERSVLVRCQAAEAIAAAEVAALEQQHVQQQREQEQQQQQPRQHHQQQQLQSQISVDKSKDSCRSATALRAMLLSESD